MSENKLEPHFQKKCVKLCEKFLDLLKPELEYLKDFEVEVEFKVSAKPKFCKPRSVPFALQSDGAQVYNAGIAQGI